MLKTYLGKCDLYNPHNPAWAAIIAMDCREVSRDWFQMRVEPHPTITHLINNRLSFKEIEYRATSQGDLVIFDKVLNEYHIFG